MTALEAYRDDGPLAARLRRAAAARRTKADRLGWLVPPLVRTLEYGGLVALTALAEPRALPACFALLVVLAFHHYDIVYRLRHQRLAPPAWLGAVGGGWDGRLLAAAILAVVGGLEIGLAAAAVALGCIYVAESAASWLRFERAGRPAASQDEDADDVVE